MRLPFVVPAAFFLGWLCAAQPGYALGLYEGEVPVAATGQATDSDVLAALNQVLVRLTGRAEENLTAVLGISARSAEGLLLGRQFRNVEIPQDDGGTQSERRLRMEFDPVGINRLLRDGGLPRWGGERPQILLWLVVEGETGAEFAASDPVLDFALQEAAFEFGLPVFTPLFDARDVAEVRVADVRGGFVEAAIPAARRYGADLVVMADLRPTDNYWTGRWVWRLGESDQGFERSAQSRGEVLRLGMGRIAGALAARFAISPDAAARHQLLVVSGVLTPVQYAEILRYLENLSLVDRVRLRSARADELAFELSLSAGGLEDIIGLSDMLVFERRDPRAGSLRYRLAW